MRLLSAMQIDYSSIKPAIYLRHPDDASAYTVGRQQLMSFQAVAACLQMAHPNEYLL